MSDELEPTAYHIYPESDELIDYVILPHQKTSNSSEEEALFAASDIIQRIEEEQAKHGMGTDAWTALEMVIRDLRSKNDDGGN
jgi:hypothetical protein